MKIIRALLHLTIILSFMMLVLFFINRVNTAMGFLEGTEFLTLLVLLCTTAITTSILVLVRANRVRGRRKSGSKKN